MPSEENKGVVLVRSCQAMYAAEGNAWVVAGAFLLQNQLAIIGAGKGKEAFADLKVEKDRKKELNGNFCRVLTDKAGGEIPTTGLNIQTGEQFEIRDDKGVAKLRSWAPTSQLVKNLTSLWPYMFAFGFKACFRDGQLIGRTEMERKVKELTADSDKETALEAIQRSLKTASDNLDKISDPIEVQVADAEITALYSKWVAISAQYRGKAVDPITIGDEVEA